MKMKYKHFTFFIVAAMLFSACVQQDSAPQNPASSIKPVDKIFREFYNRQGGEERLGNAISDIQLIDGQKIQYLESSLMIFDPLAPADQRFYFKSLGTDLGYFEVAPGGVYPQANDNVIDGYVIYPAFISAYNDFGGERFTGKLISSWTVNETNGYIEQHFETIGFYIMIEDPENSPKLLPYGMLACGYDCLIDQGITNGLIDSNILREPFASDALTLGAVLLGNHLFGAFQNPDGYEEVIFENAVLIAPSGSSKSFPKPIAEELGYGNHPLVPPMDNPYVTFMLIDQGLGHNIPNFFIEYMKGYGGVDFYGLPISELLSISDIAFRQCFKNMCLEYHTNIEDESKQIFPSPLGYQYQTDIFSTFQSETDSPPQTDAPPIAASEPTEEAPVPSAPAQTDNSIPTNIFGQLTLWEYKVLINSQDSQVIYVSIYNEGIPLPQIELVIKYNAPNIQTQVLIFPLTDSEGNTKISLPPIIAENGTIIDYQVCPRDANLAILCENENFVIWGN